MKIPINVPIISKEEIKEVQSVLTEKSLTSSANSGGKRVQEFEQLLSSFVKSRFVIAVNSGTAALQAALYAFDIKNRDKLMKKLNSEGIGASVYYSPPVHKTPFYKNKLKLPVTEWAASNVLSLPVHPLVNKQNLHQIAKIIHQVIKK